MRRAARIAAGACIAVLIAAYVCPLGSAEALVFWLLWPCLIVALIATLVLAIVNANVRRDQVTLLSWVAAAILVTSVFFTKASFNARPSAGDIAQFTAHWVLAWAHITFAGLVAAWRARASERVALFFATAWAPLMPWIVSVIAAEWGHPGAGLLVLLPGVALALVRHIRSLVEPEDPAMPRATMIHALWMLLIVVAATAGITFDGPRGIAYPALALDVLGGPFLLLAGAAAWANRRSPVPMDLLLRCRVCALLQDEPPWGLDGKTPSHTICDCCGAEFGYEDHNPSALSAYRKRWVAAGGQWFREESRPDGWSLEAQLRQIPDRFR